MARGLNKVMLIGNVGQDPEVRSTGSGTRVANVSLATTRTWNDRNGQQQEQTEWHRLVFWDKAAEIIEEYVSKGDKLYVEGRIEYRQWEDDEGRTRYSTDIRVRNFLMLGGPRAGQGSGQGSGGASRGQPAPPAGSGGQSQDSEAGGENFEPGEEDDLPF